MWFVLLYKFFTQVSQIFLRIIDLEITGIYIFFFILTNKFSVYIFLVLTITWKYQDIIEKIVFYGIGDGILSDEQWTGSRTINGLNRPRIGSIATLSDQVIRAT